MSLFNSRLFNEWLFGIAPIEGAGALAFGFESSGEGDVFVIGGSFTFGFALDGTGTEGIAGDGAIALAFSTSGAGVETFVATGSLVFPIFGESGTGNVRRPFPAIVGLRVVPWGAPR